MVSLFKKRRIFGSPENEITDIAPPSPTNTKNICELQLQQEALEKFRQSLKDEKIDGIPEDDDVLMRFLRVKAFKVEESVSLFRCSKEWEKKNEDLLKIPLADCKGAFESGALSCLKQRDAHGRRVIYIMARNWNPEEVPLIHGYKACWYLVEEMIKSVETQNNGVVAIFDLGHLPMAKIAYFVSFFTFKMISRMIGFYQGGYPIKVKGVYFITSPFLVTSTFQAVKYLLKKKLRNRIIVDSTGPQILHESLGKENLPDCLDGDIDFEDAIDKDILKRIYAKHKF